MCPGVGRAGSYGYHLTQSEELTSWKQIRTDAKEMWERGKPYPTAGRNIKLCSCCELSTEVSQTIKKCPPANSLLLKDLGGRRSSPCITARFCCLFLPDRCEHLVKELHRNGRGGGLTVRESVQIPVGLNARAYKTEWKLPLRVVVVHIVFSRLAAFHRYVDGG